ncbi:MAG: protein kinase [Phycisphaerae bacterium]|nr:protein kinase [Phycisphaerae bacterium]
MMSENNSERDPLEELAAEFTERCRRGEQPSVEEYAQRHPELAADIRELFSMIVQVEHAKTTGTGQPPPGPAGTQPAPRQLGDFRIIRELGRGGMGIVYEAEQESLGRRVAIKVLPSEYLSSESRRRRFEREARTAARLHHTNIVQIFGVGEHDGHPYFVMQYIRGVGLDAVFRSLATRNMSTRSSGSQQAGPSLASSDLIQVARALLDSRTLTAPASADAIIAETDSAGRAAASTGKPSACPPVSPAGAPAGRSANGSPASSLSGPMAYWNNLARLFAQAADALSFAHQQGVLHRDIKPANLLLDADGMLWVTDFGLAKTEDFAELTQADDVVGTLRYMAPEQHERRCDVRSDVYGLGISLYELATLRPAFVEKDGGGLKAILSEPLFPPRRLCPTMPRDLETIILKAAARESQHRYSSAAELRDDLLRFVSDLPIQARRISAPERLFRWARRNPALATAAGLILVLLVSIAAISSTAYFKVHKANQVTHVQMERAQSTADLAVAAIDAIFEEFAPVGPAVSQELSLDGAEDGTLVVKVPPVLSPETAAFLRRMLSFYQELARQEGNAPALLLKMAAAQRRVGDIYSLLGQYEAARTAYEESTVQYERLRETASDDGRLDVALARVKIQLGQTFAAEDEMPQAEEPYEAARQILQSKLDAGSASEEVRFELARACYMLTNPMGAAVPIHPIERPRDGRPDPAGQGPDGPPRGLGRPPELLPPDGPPPPEPEGRLPPGPPPRSQPPDRGDRRRDGGESRARLQQAIELLTGLIAEKPRVPEYRHLLALCLREPPGPRRVASRPADNGPVEQAVAILEDLASEYPHIPQYQFDLSETYAMQARWDGSANRLEKAVDIMQSLVSQWPNVPSYQFSLGRLHLRLWDECMRAGRPDAALPNLQRGIELQADLAKRYPSVPSYAMATAFSELTLAQWQQERSRHDEARTLLESAVRRLDQLTTTEGHKPHVRMLAAQCYEQLARVYRSLGKEDLSREAEQKSAALRPPRRPGPPGEPDGPRPRSGGGI